MNIQTPSQTRSLRERMIPSRVCKHTLPGSGGHAIPRSWPGLAEVPRPRLQGSLDACDLENPEAS